MTKVVLAPSAIESIALEARRSLDGSETGGILLGRDVGHTLLVKLAGGPGPLAFRARTVFRRDISYSNDLALEAWRNGRNVWIGDWHTHLDLLPAPSPTDYETYCCFLRDQTLGFSRFLSVIVLSADATWRNPELFAWEVSGLGVICRSMEVET